MSPDNVVGEVVVSIKDDVVQLVFDGEEDDPAEYGAEENIIDKKKLDAVENTYGKPPRGDNMRALLRCNGGKLKFDNVCYRISVQPPRKESQSGKLFFVLVVFIACATFCSAHIFFENETNHRPGETYVMTAQLLIVWCDCVLLIYLSGFALSPFELRRDTTTFG